MRPSFKPPRCSPPPPLESGVDRVRPGALVEATVSTYTSRSAFSRRICRPKALQNRGATACSRSAGLAPGNRTVKSYSSAGRATRQSNSDSRPSKSVRMADLTVAYRPETSALLAEVSQQLNPCPAGRGPERRTETSNTGFVSAVRSTLSRESLSAAGSAGSGRELLPVLMTSSMCFVARWIG